MPSYKLGEQVNIDAYMKKTEVYLPYDPNSLQRYADNPDVELICGDTAKITKFRKVPTLGTGIVCGVRTYSFTQTFELRERDNRRFADDDDVYERYYFKCISSTKQKFYMVAVNLNTIRLVLEEDMQLAMPWLKKVKLNSGR